MHSFLICEAFHFIGNLKTERGGTEHIKSGFFARSDVSVWARIRRKEEESFYEQKKNAGSQVGPHRNCCVNAFGSLCVCLRIVFTVCTATGLADGSFVAIAHTDLSFRMANGVEVYRDNGTFASRQELHVKLPELKQSQPFAVTLKLLSFAAVS